MTGRLSGSMETRLSVSTFFSSSALYAGGCCSMAGLTHQLTSIRIRYNPTPPPTQPARKSGTVFLFIISNGAFHAEDSCNNRDFDPLLIFQRPGHGIKERNRGQHTLVRKRFLACTEHCGKYPGRAKEHILVRGHGTVKRPLIPHCRDVE